MDLFDEDHEEGRHHQEDSRGASQSKIRINKAFAKSFEEKERQKELERAKYLSDDEDYSDSEDEESEDDNAGLLSHELDMQIMKTIAQIKNKDPKIYDSSAKWFASDSGNEEESSDDNGAQETKHRKKTYKDVVREQILDDDVLAGDLAASKSESAVTLGKKNLIYDSEQQELRKAFLESFDTNKDVNNEADEGDSDENEGRMFTVKKKSRKQLEEEQAELRQAVAVLNSNSGQTDADKFLADFITSRKWIADAKTTGVENYDSSDVDDEEDELDREDLFESQYNFRFEELEQTGKLGFSGVSSGLQGVQVQGHSRNVEGTVRRVDDKRKQKRQEREERKAHEKRQKEEELKRLKNLKKEEVCLCLSLAQISL
jgi:protein KRI1